MTMEKILDEDNHGDAHTAAVKPRNSDCMYVTVATFTSDNDHGVTARYIGTRTVHRFATFFKV